MKRSFLEKPGGVVIGSPITGGADTRVLFQDGGSVGQDAGFTYLKSLDALLVTGLVQTGLIWANSTTTQPIIYGFAQSDPTKYIQFYHNGTDGYLTAVNPSGGDLNITSNNGDININVPDGSYVNINDRILGVNNVTSWVTSGLGAETPAWLHLFANNSVQSTGGFSMFQVTNGRDGASATDQSNGFFINSTGNYTWGAHVNMTDAVDYGYGFVVGNHGTNSVAGVFYTDNSATNTGVMMNSGVTGAFNLLQFRSDYHPVTGATGTTFSGKYISFQSGTTEHSYVDYTGAAKFAGASGAPVLTLGNGTSGVDYQFIKVDGQDSDLTQTWKEDEQMVQLKSTNANETATFLVGQPPSGFLGILDILAPLGYSAFGIGSPLVAAGFVVQGAQTTDNGPVLFLGVDAGTPLSDGTHIGSIQMGGSGASPSDYAAVIDGYTDGAWSSSSTPAKLLIKTTPSGVAGVPVQRLAIYSDGNTVFNETGVSTADFRMESDSDTNIFFLDASNNSLRLGGATTSKLGFYGVTEVDQPATVSDPSGGGTQDTEARTAIIAVIDRLQELGLIA